jgi:hypothetical protein
LAVLARWGIGIVDDELIKHEAGDRARAENLRRVCEELGTMTLAMSEGLLLKSIPNRVFPIICGQWPESWSFKDSPVDRGPIICAILRWTLPSSPAICRGDLTASSARSIEAIFGFGRVSRTWKRLERAVARTNAAIIVAACIVGLAMVIPFYRPQGREAWIGVVFWIAVAAVVAGSVRALWRLRK